MDYLKIGSANDLEGSDRKLYRALEALPGILAWGSLIGLTILSYFKSVFVAYFIIAFDVYWLLLVLYLNIYLVTAYRRLKKNVLVNWQILCESLPRKTIITTEGQIELVWSDIIHLIVLPVYTEGLDIIEPTIKAIAKSNFPLKNFIVVLAVEARGGATVMANAEKMREKYGQLFRNFLVIIHPDGLPDEIKGKGSNQAWAARVVKEQLIDAEKIDYNKILVTVFDIDTVSYPNYFHNLTYHFLTAENPYRASYQPIPIYHNNLWQAQFFARIAASSNSFWQMMQQIRQEKLATYSSHSMTWRALVDIGFWSTKMVSEDSRIFWHCFCYYKGDYRVEPMYYPVSMDVCVSDTFLETAKSLYKQQRRWGWGVENVPYLIFNAIKNWKNLPKKRVLDRIFVQLHGFHSWATNALIIAAVGWLPIILGGDSFNSTTLSANLPFVTKLLMTLAMSGLILSAIISTLLLPPKPHEISSFKYLLIPLEWIVLPASIIIFGSIPALESQTRLMFGKYLGFRLTPKKR